MRIEVNSKPHGISISPNGLYIYVACKEAVSIIATEDNTKIDASGIHGTGWEIAFTPNNAYAYVTNGNHTGEEGVEIIQLSTMEKIETIYLGPDTYGPRGIAIHPVTSSGKITTLITCKTSKNEITEGEILVVSGIITSISSNKTVIVTFIRPDNSKFNATVTTDSNGNFQYSFSTDMIGSWKIFSLWNGDDTYDSAKSSISSFNVRSEKDDGGIVMILIPMILILFLFGIIYLRKRKHSLS
jgi:DNA-binding beta-propeller fold protein YncE